MAAADGEFAYFRLQGDRFDPPGMPLAALTELVAYQDLVLDVARRLWLGANPARQRVSPGFFEGLDLRISHVGEGSSVPVIRRYLGGQETVDLDVDDYFTASRDIVTDAVTHVRTHDSLTGEFPPGSLPKLRNLGRSLGDAETLTIGHPTERQRRVELTRAVRETIRRIDEQTSSEAVVQLAGLIVEFDVEESTFELRVGDAHRVPCPFDVSQARGVHQLMALANDEEALVTVRGKALVDANGVVQRFVEPVQVESVPVNAMVSVLQRLSALLTQSDGDPFAPEEPNREAITLLREGLVAELARLYPDVAFADLPDGSLRVEFVRRGIEHVAQFDPDEGMYLYQFDPATGKDDEFEFASYDLDVLREFLRGEGVF